MYKSDIMTTLTTYSTAQTINTFQQALDWVKFLVNTEKVAYDPYLDFADYVNLDTHKPSYGAKMAKAMNATNESYIAFMEANYGENSNQLHGLPLAVMNYPEGFKENQRFYLVENGYTVIINGINTNEKNEISLTLKIANFTHAFKDVKSEYEFYMWLDKNDAQLLTEAKNRNKIKTTVEIHDQEQRLYTALRKYEYVLTQRYSDRTKIDFYQSLSQQNPNAVQLSMQIEFMKLRVKRAILNAYKKDLKFKFTKNL